ncbi:hypothetical protein FPOAC1_005614 [Fusarium poae]|uniref:hypothetical protein n=1 Tax=Fusarium poae TaxID=36050 RepID=UPI001CE99711|nr:hypothetical protein FPOAC1_005614 [Fusarium poae]KAG8672348.1 hypothetical protein FPOAC1_005614 [Fusarium poae]
MSSIRKLQGNRPMVINHLKPMNQMPQTPQAHASQSPQGQYPIQHQISGQPQHYQSSAQGPQLHQSPLAQNPGLPQQYVLSQQPSAQTVPYGVAAPPTPSQHQQQYQQQTAQFSAPPSASAQGQLQATAQSLFKSGKGFLGNIASNIKSKYPATTSSTISYTGEAPKPTYNPAQHPTQTPLSPTNSFPQGYDQSQQVAVQHESSTSQQNISPSALGYPPASHQSSFPIQSQGVPGQSSQQVHHATQQLYHQPQVPVNVVAVAQAATSSPPVHSPTAAASPYPQPSLNHQQSDPYAPTAPTQAPQIVAHAGPYGALPGHQQGHPQAIPLQQNYHSPSSNATLPPSWPQQTSHIAYSPAVPTTSSASAGQETVQVITSGYGPVGMHSQQSYYHNSPITQASPSTPHVIPQMQQPTVSSSHSQSLSQMASPLPQQQYQSTVEPAYHQQHLHQQGQLTASETKPPSHVPPYSGDNSGPANYTQGNPSGLPSQHHPNSAPTAQIHHSAPSMQGQYQATSQAHPQSMPHAPEPVPQTATPNQNHIPLPSSPLQTLNQPSGILPSAPEAGIQHQAYSLTVAQQTLQPNYGQPLYDTPTIVANNQYHQQLATQAPAPAPAPSPATAGQGFQPHQPAQQPVSPYQPVPAPSQPVDNVYHQDPLTSLSAQMNNLNVQNIEQRQTNSAVLPVHDDGPRGPPSCLAAGMASDTLPYCPEGRVVAYALDWYRLIAVPQYLVCTKCYEGHVTGTHLAINFERYHSPEGTESKCGFWSPRAREVLWPRALQTNDIDPLRIFAEKTLTLPKCKGRVWSTAADNVKWWGMINNEVDGFISCETCYEDRIVGTAFERRFSPYRQQGPDENWMCDLCIPYIATVAVKMFKANNWSGFTEAVKSRVHLPACEGKDEESNNGHWILPRRRINNMKICEACYLDKLALTRFGNEFERHQRAEGFDAFMESLGQKWKCSLTDTAVNMSIALEAALYRRDFEVFWNAASAICSLVPCTANGIIGGNWWTIAGGCPDFDVCEACYKGALQTSNLERFFEPAKRDPTATITCNFCPSSPRWGTFITKFAEALDKGIFSYYSDYVRKWAGVRTCPGIKNRDKSKWWGHPEALACEDCWLNFVADTPLGDTVPVKGVYDERPLICQLWSPRMRNMWLAACAAGPPGSSESQKALDEFRAFGTKRVQVYNATVPHIEMIQSMMMMKRMQAMQQGQLSLMYQGMNGMSSIMGTTDGNLHGNSSIGYYETENGVTAANMMNNMHAGMADSNKMSDWMQMAQLQATWMEPIEKEVSTYITPNRSTDCDAETMFSLWTSLQVTKDLNIRMWFTARTAGRSFSEGRGIRDQTDR